ncbi:MAG: hypothetical protein ACREQQ_09025 [Candidatus Binatia bacterium]
MEANGKRRPLILALNETRKTLLASRIEIVDAPAPHSPPIRDAIRPGDAVWVEACNGVDMSRRLGSLDLLFLDSGHRVVAAFSGSKHGRAEVPGASSVLELAPGTIALTSTREGDRIVFEPIVAEANGSH